MLLAYGLTVDGMLGWSLMDDHLKLRDHCGFTSHPPALRTNGQTHSPSSTFRLFDFASPSNWPRPPARQGGRTD